MGFMAGPIFGTPICRAGVIILLMIEISHHPKCMCVCIHTYVLYYQKSYAFGIRGLHNGMQNFYHQQ